MPNTREKLIELLQNDDCPLLYVLGENIGTLADYLIANGVGFREQDCHWATEQAYKNGKADALKWISVKERLPEQDGAYLVFRKWHNFTYTEVWKFSKDARTVDKYDFTRKWENVWYEYDSEVGHYTTEDVTHWMPLPDFPKGA